MKKRLIHTIALIATVFAPLVAFADYDYTRDFSLSTNPSGVWSYGWRNGITGTSFNTYESFGTLPATNGDLTRWHTLNQYLGAYKNLTNLTIDFGEGTLVPAGESMLIPETNQASVARFTAPIDGDYIVTTATSRFGGSSGGLGFAQFDEIINGNSIFTEIVNQAYIYQPTHVEQVALAAGDKLDFTVSDGDGVYFHDTIGIRANVRLLNVIKPTLLNVSIGNKTAGSVASLGSDDADALVVCKGFIPSLQSPFVQFVVGGTVPQSNISELRFQDKVRMSNAGSFLNSFEFFNWSTGTYDQSVAFPVTTVSHINDVKVMGALSDYVLPNGGVQTRVRIRLTGFSAVATPCASFEFARWTFIP